MFKLSYDDAVIAVYESVSGHKVKHHDRINMRCPLCGDSSSNLMKKRGWLYRDADGGCHYNCFNCGENINGVMFLAKIKNMTYRDVIHEMLSKDASFDNKKVSIFIQPEEKKEAPSLDNARKEWIPVESNETCKSLLESRFIDQAPFKPYGWKLYYDSNKNALVIPWTLNGKVVTWQWRKIEVKPNDKKYEFPFNAQKMVFGLSSIDYNFSNVFLLEGAFDAIFVRNGIAAGGLTLSNSQKEMIQTYAPSGFKIVLLSNNPWIDIAARKYLIKLVDDAPNTLVFEWKQNERWKDVNDAIIDTKNVNMFADKNFLESRIIKLSSYAVSLKLKFR